MSKFPQIIEKILLVKAGKAMRHLMAITLVLGAVLVGCQGPVSPTVRVPGKDAPFPPTWTPTAPAEHTPTASLVVQATPTWDGTPPPPSEAYVPRLIPSKLYRALKDEEAITVVDLRNLASFEQAHIPGAVHIPLEELPERFGELDGNKTIVFYCLSPNEAMSLQAAMTLYRMGFARVEILDGGIQRWYSDGYPIEGTLLTPTPGKIGPPWTVTPVSTSTSLPTSTPLPRATRTPTRVQRTRTRTVTPTATKAD